MAPDSSRLAMLRKGLQGQPWAEVSDWEIRRQGVSYTVDTVRAWARMHPRSSLAWILGSDQWDLLPSWRDPGELGRRLLFLVFPRPHLPRARKGFRMKTIPMRLDLSATEIRGRIKKRLSIEGMVLPAVQAMIQKHRWYR